MNIKYTKAQLEELVYCQLENLNAMNDLLSIMKLIFSAEGHCEDK